MHPRIQLSLASALLVVTACSSKTIVGDEESETNGDSSDSGVGETDESAEGTDTELPEPMCTLENYANDPQLGAFTEVGCVPAESGSCAACELPCMTAIVDDCEECTESKQPGEPPDCFNECGEHLVLCSEQLGDQCCHLVTANYVGPIPGRPLRELGTPRLPDVTVLGTASDAGHRYREFARYERASVDAFLFAAAVLEQLGAPHDLVQAHATAAREEAEHARLALASAQDLDGCVATLGELPGAELDVDLERFVCDLIHDGCVGELVAAREAAWALAQASVRQREPLRRYWRAVMIEETTHAQLAWRTLEWLLEARPALASLITRELAAAIEPRPQTVGDRDHRLHGIATLGLASPATQAALREQAITELVATARGQLAHRVAPTR
jgi:hypothetical protein